VAQQLEIRRSGPLSTDSVVGRRLVTRAQLNEGYECPLPPF
jgi:hypothetical protein